MPSAPRFTRGAASAGVALVAVLTAGCHQSATDQPVPNTTQTVSVTVDELSSRFRENELAAEAMYAGTNLNVRGTVSGIELGETDRPVVLLAGVNADVSVRAELAPNMNSKAAMLNEGDTVVFRCRDVSELAQAPMLRNCEF